jgi:hypothetical protein
MNHHYQWYWNILATVSASYLFRPSERMHSTCFASFHYGKYNVWRPLLARILRICLQALSIPYINIALIFALVIL